MSDVDAAERALERNPHLNDLVRDGDRHIRGLSIRILQRDGQREIKDVSGLFEVQHRSVTSGAIWTAGSARSLDPIRERHARQRAVIDPSLEESLERATGFRFHRLPEILRSCFGEPRVDVKPPQAFEERIIAHQPTKHVQHHRALVVDHGAKGPPFVLDVPDAIPQIHRTLIRFVHGPTAHLSNDAAEYVVAAEFLRVERGKVLREPLAEPLLVVVAPADRLPPPLVRDFVRQEKLRVRRERRRIVAPRDPGVGRRLIQDREVPGTMTARKRRLDDRERERRVRRVADDRFVELHDVDGPFGQPFAAAALSGMRFDDQVEFLVRRRIDDRRCRCPHTVERRITVEDHRPSVRAIQLGDEKREIAQRPGGGKRVDLPRLGSRRGRRDRLRRIRSLLSARDAAVVARHRNLDRSGGVIGHRGLRIPVTHVAVEKRGIRFRDERVVDFRRRRGRIALQHHGLALGRLRLESSAVLDRHGHLGVLQHGSGQVHENRVLIHHAQAEEAAELTADDRPHHERIGEANHQLAEARRADAKPHHRSTLDPLTFGDRRDVDVVVDDVEWRQVVFVVEPPARLELANRRVRRNIAMPASLEERDVLGLSRRSRIGERVKPTGPDFRKEIIVARQDRPGLAREIRQIDAVRFRRLFPEDLLGPFEIAWIDGPRVQHRRIGVSPIRAKTHERRIESRFECLGSRVDPNLTLLGVWRRMKIHFAVAEQHQARHTLIGFDHEHGAVDQRHLEIFGEHREVVRVELLLRVHREAIEVFDRGKHLLTGNPPVVVDTLDVEQPRRDPRPVAVLHERIDGQRVAVARERAREVLTIALLNHDTRSAGPKFRTGEIRGALLVGGTGEQIEKGRGVRSPRDLLEPLQQAANFRIVGISLGGRCSRDDRPQAYRAGTPEAGQRSNERRDDTRVAHPWMIPSSRPT